MPTSSSLTEQLATGDRIRRGQAYAGRLVDLVLKDLINSLPGTGCCTATMRWVGA